MKFLLILLVFGVGFQKINAQTVPEQHDGLIQQGYTRLKSQQAPDLLNPTWRNIIASLVNYCENNSSEKSSETFYYDLPDSERKKIAEDVKKIAPEFLALEQKLLPEIKKMKKEIELLLSSRYDPCYYLPSDVEKKKISPISELISDLDDPKVTPTLEKMKKKYQSQIDHFKKQCHLIIDKAHKLELEYDKKRKLLASKHPNTVPNFNLLELAPIQIWKFRSGPCESLEIKRSPEAFENPGSITLITRKPVKLKKPTSDDKPYTNEIKIFDNWIEGKYSMLSETDKQEVRLKPDHDISYNDAYGIEVRKLIETIGSAIKTPQSPPTGTNAPPAKARQAQ